MKTRMVVGAALLAWVALVTSSHIVAGDKKKDQKKEQKKDQAKEGAGAMAPPKPGAEHKLLAKLAGKWDAKIKMWMGPGDPTQSTATITRTMVMGGLYLKEDVAGEFMKMKFNGMAIMGYDVNKKKYFSVWIDNFGTGAMVTEGDYNAGTKTVTFLGEENNPMLGGKVKTRDTLKFVSDDVEVMEMHRTPADGKEFKVMEITATRIAPKKK